MKKSQKGFIVPLLIAITAVLVVGVILYHYWQINPSTGTNSINNAVSVATSTNGNSESGELCSDLTNVPDKYKPSCDDLTTNQVKYSDSSGQSVNFPSSQMFSYIGQ